MSTWTVSPREGAPMAPGTRVIDAWMLLHWLAAVVVLAGGGALLGWTLVQEMAR